MYRLGPEFRCLSKRESGQRYGLDELRTTTCVAPAVSRKGPNLISEAFLEFLLFQAEPAFLHRSQLTTLVHCPTLASTIKELTSAEDIFPSFEQRQRCHFQKRQLNQSTSINGVCIDDPSVRMCCYLRGLTDLEESEFKTPEILGMLEKRASIDATETATRKR